jgi:hypothetical protein
MRNIRDRGLVSQLCKKAGINETQNWVNHSYESTKSFIEQAGIISPTDLHGVHAGLYKHASKQGWLDMLKKDFGWGKYIGLDGDVYDSIPEMIVANLLHILSIPYVQQPPYTHFRGMKGGVMRADFLLDDAYWIEVWGFAKESRENYIFKDYSEKREYKEYNCKVSNLELIGIDGFKYYHGKYKGVSRFTEYALNKLSVAIGVAPAIDTIVSQLRTSVALAAAGLSVGGSKAAKK